MTGISFAGKMDRLISWTSAARYNHRVITSHKNVSARREWYRQRDVKDSVRLAVTTCAGDTIVLYLYAEQLQLDFKVNFRIFLYQGVPFCHGTNTDTPPSDGAKQILFSFAAYFPHIIGDSRFKVPWRGLLLELLIMCGSWRKISRAIRDLPWRHTAPDTTCTGALHHPSYSGTALEILPLVASVFSNHSTCARLLIFVCRIFHPSTLRNANTNAMAGFTIDAGCNERYCCCESEGMTNGTTVWCGGGNITTTKNPWRTRETCRSKWENIWQQGIAN